MQNLNVKSMGIALARQIGQVNLRKEKLINQYLEPFDITAAQFKVLVAVHFYKMNAPVDICHYLDINGGSMTRMVDRLVKKSVLDKRPNPEDKRGVLLALTENGESLLMACIEVMENTIGPLMVGDLSDQEVEQLNGLLQRLMPV